MEFDSRPISHFFFESSNVLDDRPQLVLESDRRSFLEAPEMERMMDKSRTIPLTEQRRKAQLQDHQWYFDEFAGLYRHIVATKEKPVKYTPEISSPSLSMISEAHPWPVPSGIQQVQQLCKLARSTKNPQRQLSLCKSLMNSQQDLKRKKNRELDLVIVSEAQKLLKDLSSNTRANATEAQLLLASCYGIGNMGLPVDREKAFSLYLQASKHNDPESNYRAGVCYELGIGTKRDYSRAVSFYRRAATLSHVAGMYKLAIILLRGYCQQVKNPRESIALLQRAASLASKSVPHPMHALAILMISNEFSDHLIVDTDYALELLHSAAKLNYVPSQVKLGEMYETGKWVEVNDARSIYWYSKAAEMGSAEGALALSGWHLTGSPNVLGQSDREAYLWARKAAMCQNTDRWTMAKAYFLIGMYVEMNIGVVEEEDAVFWFQRSAALGHKGALEKIKYSATSHMKMSRSYIMK
ncbi:hypothetical protein BY458DRAFT_559807 [Sporodiniella umbellata]|nr:hypothetical protein BY458DRAFT_559807 [Sporodiniella umbellata]